MKKFLWLSLTLLSVLLVSCLEYSEKLWLNSDGSGRMTFKIGVDKFLLSMEESEGGCEFDEQKIKAELETVKGIRITYSSSYSDSERKWIEVSLDFDSLGSLLELSKKRGIGVFIGEISLSPDSNGNWVFNRKVFYNMDESDDSSGGGSLDEEFRSMFSKYRWVYETYFPARILSANTTEDNVDSLNNKVAWIFPLGSLMEKPQVMEASFANPETLGMPVGLIVVGVIVIVVSVGIFLAARSRKKVEKG